MPVLVVTGTGTGVGKTVTTAALAALARAGGRPVAVVKPAQTGVAPGEPGDVDDIRALSGVEDVHELARYPDPLAPATAARLAGLPPPDLTAAAATIGELAHDRLVLVEGAGGLLVRLDADGRTLADLAADLAAPVLVVVAAGLGTLNATALTLAALARRGLSCAGVLVGAWPTDPDLASRCNLADLAAEAGQPLAGVLPDGMGALPADRFLVAARDGVSPRFGGTFDPTQFTAAFAPAPRPRRGP